ncbi:unnamed protein product [Brachionus calyciflorus]|uniref:HTH CENPB-type domain-containing protein n=1 Tax=Brachionus calyciflorus TaxID=104777 RepID=A0A814RMD6_9BILA|nr:unnamed protein product [Brachionus calyciflorus]
MKSPNKQALPKKKRGRPSKQEAEVWKKLTEGLSKSTPLINTPDTQINGSSSSQSSPSSASPTTSFDSNRSSPATYPTSSSPKPPTKFRQAYRLTYKISAIRYTEKNDISKAAKKFKVDRKTIRNWVKSKPQLLEQVQKKNKFRIHKVDTAQFSELETELYEWILEKRRNGVCINKKMITTKALILNKDNNFVASNGWFCNFLRRKNLVLRRITTSGRELPKDAGKTVIDFLRNCQDSFVLHDIDRNSLVNMDETSIYLDSPSSTTYSEAGASREELSIDDIDQIHYESDEDTDIDTD